MIACKVSFQIRFVNFRMLFVHKTKYRIKGDIEN